MIRGVVIAAVLAVVSPVFAQPPDDPAAPPDRSPAEQAAEADLRCKAAFEARNPGGVIDATGNQCKLLALDVLTKIRQRERDKVSPIANTNPSQPIVTDTPGGQGSVGQTAAIASAQPVATTGGKIAAVGETGQGLQLVTALAINPASIATGDTSRRSVWTSRLADVSILLPLNIDPAEGLNNGFPYLGGRVRLSLLPAIQRAELERAVTTFKDVLVNHSALQSEVADLLTASPQPSECATAIEADDNAGQLAACGASVRVAGLTTSTQAAAKALAEFRERTDRKYLGLEGRYDRGDLNADAAASKDSLMAVYLAGGYTLNPTSDGTTLALRGRGGAVYFKDGMSKMSQYAFYGAFGVELAVVRDLRRYTLSVGGELVKRKDSDVMLDQSLTNNIRIGIAVPLADGKAVSVGFAIPTDGGDPTIAISGDWSLLLDR